MIPDIKPEFTFYENKNVKTKSFKKDGLLHNEIGPAYIKYYQNGNIEEIQYYVNGSLHRENDLQ